MSSEASELLENFQCKTSEEVIADDVGLSVEDIIRNKIIENGIKYSVKSRKVKR